MAKNHSILNTWFTNLRSIDYMDHPSPTPELIKVTEIFLIPSSFLVAALGTADTNLHRAAVSAVGLINSVLWWPSSREAFFELVESSTLIFSILVPPPTTSRLIRRRFAMSLSTDQQRAETTNMSEAMTEC
jgi:hypothetical protein